MFADLSILLVLVSLIYFWTYCRKVNKSLNACDAKFLIIISCDVGVFSYMCYLCDNLLHSIID